MQAYVAELESRAAQAEETQNTLALQQFVPQYAKQLEEQYGLTSEQAQIIAKQEGDRALRTYQAERLRTLQINSALAIAQEFKIDPRTIISLPPDKMREAAKAATQQGAAAAELAALRAENARLKMAPAQTFASPAAAAQPGGTPYVETLKAGGALPPVKEIDRYTADWLRRQTG